MVANSFRSCWWPTKNASDFLIKEKKDAQIVLDTLWKEKKPKWHSYNDASIHESPKIGFPWTKLAEAPGEAPVSMLAAGEVAQEGLVQPS